jgi:hypothetical protein
MTDTRHDGTTPPTTADPASDPMSSRMMWAMMLGCCLAIPLALIVGGASIGGIAGANPWLLGVGAILAVALVITRRISAGPRCGAPPERHG